MSRTRWDSPELLRPSALAYGALVGGTGVALHRLDIKPHFLETFLHIVVNIVFLALLNGVVEEWWFGRLYLLALLAMAAVVVWLGTRYRFALVAYGVTYAYVGITAKLVSQFPNNTIAFAYMWPSGSCPSSVFTGGFEASIAG